LPIVTKKKEFSNVDTVSQTVEQNKLECLSLATKKIFFHLDTRIEQEPEAMKNFGFVFFYFYNTLTIEQRVESLVYDFGSLLISIGI
jgi:hypothetical protein